MTTMYVSDGDCDRSHNFDGSHADLYYCPGEGRCCWCGTQNPDMDNRPETPDMTTQTPILPGDAVTYAGHPATVITGYDPADPWLPPAGQRRPAVVNIRLDAPVRGMSRQMDVPASALLPPKAA